MLAQFRPAMGMNSDITARYAANRLRVIRQVRYSLHSEKCIDLVLFLNGIPVATAELKTDFTQRHATPRLTSTGLTAFLWKRAKSPLPNRLLDFPRGALVHFRRQQPRR
jgi:type I restriction enzyme R subunit